MTPWPAATPVEAGTELLERAVSYTRASLSVVTAVDLGRSTPCREWRLAQLLRHMDDSLQALHEAGATGQVRLAPDLDPGVRSRDWAWSRACGVGRARCSGPGASFTRRSRSS